MEKKIHNLKTLKGISKVINKDNYEDLMYCLLQGFSLLVAAKESEPDTLLNTIEWIDDGINELTHIKIKDPITNEVKIYNPQKI